jgi:hypothetical protein
MTKTPRRSTTAVEVARIYNLLGEHLEVIRPAGDGYPDALVMYKGDMDDEKIAKMISPTLTHIHVRHVRREGYGDLYRRPGNQSLKQHVDVGGIAQVLYGIVSVLNRNSLMSHEEETHFIEVIDNIAKSARNG